jgi:hypothetical protein
MINSCLINKAFHEIDGNYSNYYNYPLDNSMNLNNDVYHYNKPNNKNSFSPICSKRISSKPADKREILKNILNYLNKGESHKEKKGNQNMRINLFKK